MGGTIKVAFRLHDGTVKADTTWTNAVPHRINAREMMNDDAAYLAKYASESSGYRSNGTDVTVSPTSYGLIVIDAITHTIYSGNGYCTPGEFDATRIMRETRHDPDDFKHWDGLLREGRLSVVGELGTPLPGFDKDSPLTITEQARAVYEMEERTRVFTTVKLDLSPWKVRTFGQTPGLDMLNALVEDGFPITDRDRSAWTHWMLEQSRDD